MKPFWVWRKCVKILQPIERKAVTMNQSTVEQWLSLTEQLVNEAGEDCEAAGREIAQHAQNHKRHDAVLKLADILDYAGETPGEQD